jgi:hypothetical protein
MVEMLSAVVARDYSLYLIPYLQSIIVCGGTICIGFSSLYLTLYLTPSPSPAYFVGQTRGFLAGEGRLIERGLCPLSELTPPLKHVRKRAI